MFMSIDVLIIFYKNIYILFIKRQIHMSYCLTHVQLFQRWMDDELAMTVGPGFIVFYAATQMKQGTSMMGLKPSGPLKF